MNGRIIVGREGDRVGEGGLGKTGDEVVNGSMAVEVSWLLTLF